MLSTSSVGRKVGMEGIHWALVVCLALAIRKRVVVEGCIGTASRQIDLNVYYVLLAVDKRTCCRLECACDLPCACSASVPSALPSATCLPASISHYKYSRCRARSPPVPKAKASSSQPAVSPSPSIQFQAVAVQLLLSPFDSAAHLNCSRQR